MLDTQLQTYLSGISEWRQTKDDELRSDDGWLTLVGLLWLNEGINSIGSGTDCAVMLPESAPKNLGVITFANGQAHLTVTTDEPVIVDEAPVKSAVLRDDHAEGGASLVNVGSITFFVIKRADQYGIRVRDAKSDALKSFTGRRWYPVDPAYRVAAAFIPHETSRTVQVMSSAGVVLPMDNPGYLEFELHGQRLRLEAFDAEDDRWWLIFKDGTSGVTTYGAGRFLYVPRQTDEGIWIDFNRAYHPPCTFTPYATCPLPPRENNLTVPVEAGECF